MADREPRGAKRSWSLETAQALLVDVRERTARAVADVDRLLEGRAGRADGVDARVQERLESWALEMEALGVAVEAPWCVHFENGADAGEDRGSLCWRWPEAELTYCQGHGDGPAGTQATRLPIQ